VQYVVGFAVALVAIWVALVVTLALVRPKGLRPTDYVRLLPDLLVLIQGLARDRSIPRRIRARLWILLAWMISPIDLIPDVIPVIGFADDVILCYIVLRSVVRATDVKVLRRNWRGTGATLAAVERLLGVRESEEQVFDDLEVRGGRRQDGTVTSG